MDFKAFLMADSSSLPRAPLRNWSGRCFTSRLFRGLGADVGSGVGVGLGVSVGSGVGSVVGSGLGAVGTGRIFGVELAVVAMLVEGADSMGLLSKAIFSTPYIEIQITVSEAPLINWCFSIPPGLRHMPSIETMVRRSVILSLILRGSCASLCVRSYPVDDTNRTKECHDQRPR